MVRNILFTVVLIAFMINTSGQNLPVEILSTLNCSIADGIFLNYSQFINNNPIPFNKLAIEGDVNDLHVISRAMAQKHIYFFNNSSDIEKVSTSSVWGYCILCNVYVNVGRLFLLVPKLETLSRIPEKIPEKWFIDRVENKEEITGNVDDEYQYINNIDLIVDMRTGTLHRFEPKVLIELFMPDSTLSQEYASLTKRKQKRRKLKYINTFNERNKLNLH